MKTVKLVLAVILVMGLVVGLALPVLAKPENKGEPAEKKVATQMLRGKVTEIDTAGKSFFVIQQANKEPVKITVDNNTKYYKAAAGLGALGSMPHRMGWGENKPDKGKGVGPKNLTQLHPPGKEATFEDLRIGDSVAVRVEPGTTLAKVVLILEPSGQVRTGKVTEIDTAGKSFFVIQQANKEPVKITVDNNTKYYKAAARPGASGPMPRRMGWGENKPDKGKGVGPKNLTQLRPPGKEAAFVDITMGDRVIVYLAEKSESLAKQVLILGPAYEQVTGKITALSSTDKTITITPASGPAVTVKYDANTTFTLRGTLAVAVGQEVRVAYRAKDMVAVVVRVLPATPTPAPSSSAPPAGTQQA